MSPDGGGSEPRGSDASLIALYDAVPATEELDLRDEWERDRRRRIREAWSDDDADSPEEGRLDEPELEDDPLTELQVFGMIEHLLGGELVTDDEDEPTDD